MAIVGLIGFSILVSTEAAFNMLPKIFLKFSHPMDLPLSPSHHDGARLHSIRALQEIVRYGV